MQPDGKILVGGDFTSIGGQTRNRIARLDPATGLADSFNPNRKRSTVYAIAVQPDGKILAGGEFQQHRWTAAQRTSPGSIRRPVWLIRSTRTRTSFGVYSIAVQADGKILVGGIFSNIGGQTAASIARLDAATGLADSFDPNADDSSYSIAVQADGKILAGGSFTASADRRAIFSLV